MREAGLLLRDQMLEEGQVAVPDRQKAIGGHGLGAAPLQRPKTEQASVFMPLATPVLLAF